MASLNPARSCLSVSWENCGAAVAAPQNEEDAAPVWSMADEPALATLGRCGQHNVDLGRTAYNSATSTRGAMCQGGFELVRAALGNGEHSKAEGRGLGKDI